jgi:hypothetical protein
MMSCPISQHPSLHFRRRRPGCHGSCDARHVQSLHDHDDYRPDARTLMCLLYRVPPGKSMNKPCGFV